jgi:hypothetical protein
MADKPTPQSRTGKLIQGLFNGGKAKKTSPAPYTRSRSVESIEPDEFSIPVDPRNELEETNWDDEETPDVILDRLSAQLPIDNDIPPPPTIIGDPDDWDDDALPAETVRKEAQISSGKPAKVDKKAKEAEDFWESIPAAPPETILDPLTTETNGVVNRSVGLWTTLTLQLQSFLPPAAKKFAAIILTGIFATLATLSITLVDAALARRGNDSSTPTAITAAPTTDTTPQISPERQLATALNTRLAQIASQYPDDLVSNISIDSTGDRLTVKLAPAWLEIDSAQQQQSIAKLWQQARSLQFSKLEISDNEGNLIARSPVVGNEMILVRSTVDR